MKDKESKIEVGITALLFQINHENDDDRSITGFTLMPSLRRNLSGRIYFQCGIGIIQKTDRNDSDTDTSYEPIFNLGVSGKFDNQYELVVLYNFIINDNGSGSTNYEENFFPITIVYLF